jgi:predicted membrane protein (TIGR00267 family)
MQQPENLNKIYPPIIFVNSKLKKPNFLRRKIDERIEKFRIYSSVTDISSVSRRYFVIGFFDGVLTVLGMIMGAHLSGEATSQIIISAGIATGLAHGISSGWGAYEAERIEQSIMVREKQKALLVEDKSCAVTKAHKFATYISSFVHAVAPIPAAIIPLIPYMFLDADKALIPAIALGLTSLFSVGAFMGAISKRNLLIAGLRMMLAGVATLAIVTILNPSHL